MWLECMYFAWCSCLFLLNFCNDWVVVALFSDGKMYFILFLKMFSPWACFQAACVARGGSFP